jgi:hypothetical protein
MLRNKNTRQIINIKNGENRGTRKNTENPVNNIKNNEGKNSSIF